MNGKLQVVGRARETVDLERLARMRPQELQRLYRTMFGQDVPAGNSELARRKIAWQIQADRQGGLPESARQHALAIAKACAARVRTRRTDSLPHASVSRLISDHDSRIPMPGSVIVKQHRGRTIQVRVLGDGFEYEGGHFTSLSAIASAITGTKWNGLAFFGLVKGDARGR